MKILIIGIVASGKTTLAKKLSNQTHIKYYEIDSIVHDDTNNIKRTKEEQDEFIKKIDSNKNLIIEGTLRKNLYYLLEIADKIVYLDIPLQLRKRRIVTRYIKQKLKIEKCNYKPTLKMLNLMFKWTSEYEKNKQEFERRINQYSDKLVVLKDIKEIEVYKMEV